MTTPSTTANRRTPLLVGGAFLIGVVGTAAVMSARNYSAASPSGTPPTVATAVPKAEADEGGKAEGGSEGGKGEEAGTTVQLDPDAAQNAGVRTESAAYRTVGETLTAPGTVEVSTDRVARVTPPVAGKVTRVLVRLGGAVRAGEPIALLDSYDVAQAQAAVRDAEADLQQAEAGQHTAESGVAQARGRQASAETALARQRELARAGAFSQAPLQAAQSERTQAESELLSAQAEQQRAATALARSEKLFQAGVDSRAELEQNQTTARQSQIRVDQAQARVTLARQALEREQKVFGRDLLSQREVQTAEAEVRAARGDVQRAQAEVAAARTAIAGARQKAAGARANLAALAGGSGTVRFGDGGKVIVLSPVSGTIADLSVTLGQAVERTATLMTVENLQAVVVQANVPEQDVARVRVGQRAEVTVASYPNAIFHGAVQSLASQVDEKTRTLPVRVLVDNEGGRLRPEMFAQVRLGTGASRRALVVPVSALVSSGEGASGGQAVYIAGEKAGAFEKRPVTVGKTYGDRVEIVGGLKPDDRVVVEGAFVLKSEAAKGELKDSD